MFPPTHSLHVLFVRHSLAALSTSLPPPPHHPPPLPRLLSLSLSFILSTALSASLSPKKKVLTPLCVSFYKPPSPFSLLSPWLCLSVCLPLRPRSFPIIPTYCLLSLSAAPFLCLPPSFHSFASLPPFCADGHTTTLLLLLENLIPGTIWFRRYLITRAFGEAWTRHSWRTERSPTHTHHTHWLALCRHTH